MPNLQKQLSRLAERERYDKIISLIEELPEKERDWETIGHYIRALNNTWKHERAIEVAMQFQKQGANDPYWHYRLGYSYLQLGNKKKAKQFLVQAKELAMDDKNLLTHIKQLWDALHGIFHKREPKLVHIVIDEDLISQMDDYDIEYIIKPLWYGVNIYESTEIYENDLKLFTIPQQHIFAIQCTLSR